MNQDVKRRRRLLLASAAVVIVALVVLYLLGTVLLTLGMSVVIAYVLLPVVRLLERVMPWRRSRPGLSRGLAIGVVYLALLGIVAGVLAAMVPPTIEQGRKFAEEFPAFFHSARMTLEDWIGRYFDQVPVEVRDRIEETLSQAGGFLSDAAGRVAARTWGVVSGSFSLALGLATAPVLVFYLMKDSGKVRESLSAPFPQPLRPFLKEILDMGERILGGYIRGQIILGLIVGAVVTVGLLLMGVPFALVLGIIAGITELVPVVGPWIGAIAGVLVTLATEPHLLPWVILLYLAVQLLENTLLVPRIQGDSLNLHPAAIILTIVVASHYFGLWGVIIGPPLVALFKEMFVWFVREWNRSPGVPAADMGPDDDEEAQPEDAGPGDA